MQNYFIIWVAVLSNEYNVITSIFVFWSDKVPIWGYFLIFWAAFMAFQLIGVEAFGEAEFWLALIKLLGLTAYFIFAIIYASGGLVGQQHAVGFRYWHNPGPWNGNGFRGVAAVFVFCSTFYAGVESVAVAATETRNPGVAVPQAIRQVFWRIIVSTDAVMRQRALTDCNAVHIHGICVFLWIDLSGKRTTAG